MKTKLIVILFPLLFFITRVESFEIIGKNIEWQDSRKTIISKLLRDSYQLLDENENEISFHKKNIKNQQHYNEIIEIYNFSNNKIEKITIGYVVKNRRDANTLYEILRDKSILKNKMPFNSEPGIHSMWLSTDGGYGILNDWAGANGVLEMYYSVDIVKKLVLEGAYK